MWSIKQTCLTIFKKYTFTIEFKSESLREILSSLLQFQIHRNKILFSITMILKRTSRIWVTKVKVFQQIKTGLLFMMMWLEGILIYSG